MPAVISFLPFFLIVNQSVTDVNQKNLANPFDQSSLAKLFNQDIVTQLLNQNILAQLFNRDILAQLLNQGSLSNTFHQNNLAQLFNKGNLAQPFNQDNFANPIQQNNLTEQFNISNLTPSIQKNNLAQLFNENNLAKLLSILKPTEEPKQEEKETTDNNNSDSEIQNDSDKYDDNHNSECATSNYETLTLQLLKSICGKRRNNPEFDSSSTADYDKDSLTSGGSRAKEGEWPWHVFLKFPDPEYDNYTYCGGTLITDQVVLTAAHCFQDGEFTYVEIQIGGINKMEYESDEQIFQAQKIKIHENFDSHKHDIALVWLDRKATFNCHVAPLCLPLTGDALSGNKLEGATAWMTGYGRHFVHTPTYYLRHLQLNLISNEECKQYKQDIKEDTICHISPLKDTCLSDPGSPVMLRYDDRWTVVAFVSDDEGCGIGNPGLNVRIKEHLDWIKSNVELFRDKDADTNIGIFPYFLRHQQKD